MSAGKVVAGDRTKEVPLAPDDALRQFLAAAPGATQPARKRQYLLHMCVNSEFQQWQ